MEDNSFLNKKYAHIFVDFDNTLYLWESTNRHFVEYDEGWYARIIKQTRYYEPECLNDLLIKYLKNAGAECHLLTHARASLDGETKFNFMQDHYPGLLSDYITVGSNEDKAMILYKYALSHGYYEEGRIHKILIIDDKESVIKQCRQKGFDAEMPQFVMNQMVKGIANKWFKHYRDCRAFTSVAGQEAHYL